MQTTKINGLRLPKWDSFSIEGFIDVLKRFEAEGLQLADEISKIENPNFSDIVFPFNVLSDKIALHTVTLNNLKLVLSNNYPGINEIDEEAGKIVSGYNSKLNFHIGLYNAYKKVRDSSQFEQLSDEERHIIDETIKTFELNGIKLNEENQKRLMLLKETESELGSKFSSNMVKARDSWFVHLTDDSKLKGMPLDILEMFRSEASDRELSGYVISLKSGPYSAALDMCDDRGLREELWRANNSRCSEIWPQQNKEELDNSNIMVELVLNLSEQAKILGYKNYPEMSILKKVAGGVGVPGVDNFLNTLGEATIKKSSKELIELQEFAKEVLDIDELMPWDIARVIYLHKEKFYAINDEEIRNYFPADKVVTGLINLIEKLFTCKVRINKSVDTWHDSVLFYEVCDLNDNVFAGFYADIYERNGKKGGAWMNALNYKLQFDNTRELPIAVLITNFRDEGNNNNYLSHSEITTLFHEMGHVFHHLLSKTNYMETSMMNVEWDAIELPSQFLEEWAWKNDILQSMSLHKETKEILPVELFDKLKATKHYLSGLESGAQSGLALFDWELYKEESITSRDIINLYKTSMAKTTAFPIHQDSRRPNTFSHIFGGGYTAGYFSYNWANNLVADALSAIDESGDEIDTINRYKNEILVRGSSRPFIKSFIAFRGREPKPEFLIPFLGLSD